MEPVILRQPFSKFYVKITVIPCARRGVHMTLTQILFISASLVFLPHNFPQVHVSLSL